MASKPETVFIESVHRQLKKLPVPHFEKNHNAYRGGTPDVFYSGDKADLWVEYKWIDKIPTKALILPDLSQLQRDWCGARHAEGRNVWVIVGCPEGGVVYFKPCDWNSTLAPGQFQELVESRAQLAQRIFKLVGAKCVSSEEFSPPLRPSEVFTE